MRIFPRASLALFVVFLASLVAACGREPAVPARGASAFVTDYGRLLPAFPLAHELRVPGKADVAGDYRAAHPGWYEPTVAPTAGFRAMREWEPMSTMLIAYTTSLIGDSAVGWTVVSTIKAAYPQGTVTVLVDGAAARDDLVPKLVQAGVPADSIGDGKAVRFEQLPLDAFWTIDFGPLPLVSPTNTVAFLDFKYYWGRYLDDAVPSELGERWGATVYRMPANYEGGNFQADGMGTCYTTERGLQNAGVSEADLRAYFKAYAGCDALVVLKDLAADGTGHVDMFFKLVTPARAILGSFTDAQDPQARADMNDNDTLLRGLSLPAGTAMTVLRMPHPNAYDGGWGVVPRTYLNSTLFNGLNLWPVYTADQDLQADAEAVWKEAMPGWTHVGIPSDEISTLSGAIHCITRTIPDLPLARWVDAGTCDGAAGTCLAPAGGYSGACTSSADCNGPEWLCVVAGTCGAVVDPCQGVTYEGCCDGATVRWCENGALQSLDCVAQSPSAPRCGWSTTAGYYWCDAVGAPDPSGTFPWACDGGCVPDCTAKGCDQDDGCGRACGCAAGSRCEAGVCVACVPACDGKACGDDGCGGTCGACGPDETCQSGECVNLCGGLTYEGCCDGSKVSWCDANGAQTVDCATAATTPRKCGWDATAGYYWCGDATTAEPTGTFPWACPGGCVPDCVGKTCDQDDGCGQACGCVPGLLCQGGACVGCVPACDGKVCGDDGCGGTCGACPAGLTCTAGACLDACQGLTFEGCCDHDVVRWCDNGQTFEVACSTSTAGPLCTWHATLGYYWCGDVALPEPTGAFPPACEACVPDCAARLCGSNGCFGSCGDCPDGQICRDGACEVCAPACDGKVCGDDGCLGSCGACDSGLVCQAGQCVDPCGGITFEGCCDGSTVKWCGGSTVTTIDCATWNPAVGTRCGWDAARGYYWCGDSNSVDPAGTFPWACPGGCVPACDGKACDQDDGCGRPCGCAAGFLCTAGACEACVADCAGKQCGDDGCGGSCGSCGADEQCTGGACVNRCGGLTYEGCCDGAVVRWCDSGGEQTLDCASSVLASGALCGWSAGAGYYWCGDTDAADPTGTFPRECPGSCVPACSGKDCGDDGCGGSCGACPDHHACEGGSCAYVPWCGDGTCDPTESCAACPSDCGCACGEVCLVGVCVSTACDGRMCGDDGCGGSCGTCPTGSSCAEGMCKVDPACGNGACDGAETCASCWADCACDCGEVCAAGACTWRACDDKQCGSDGCGGSCGTCPIHHVCELGRCDYVPWCGDGTCDPSEDCADCPSDCTCGCGEACAAGACTFTACVGKTCGSDGCGGSCGACADHYACQQGACAYVPWCGDGVCNGDETCSTCGADCACACGQACDHGACVFTACQGLACGSDGCGGSCGTCPDHHACQKGACAYVPWCGDGACDAGEDCGACPSDCTCGCGQACQGSTCVFTACDGRQCGDDGCGGSCGKCAVHHECRKGACAYVPWCGDGTCDAGEDCAACAADCGCGCGQECQDGACAFTGCEGRQCGDDGCGGSCGTCDAHFACQDGACAYVPWCGDGTCDPDETCASCAPDCACKCGESCVEGGLGLRSLGEAGCVYVACDGKACGDDGCGGSCGACGEHQACQDGACVAVPWCGDGSCDPTETCASCAADCGCGCGHECVVGAPGPRRLGEAGPALRSLGEGGCVFTACDDALCGDDGCGGSCGACGEHEECLGGACLAVPWCGDEACNGDEQCASCPGDCACGCGQSCQEGACVSTACQGRECGDDGCGGSCGACGEHEACEDGACVAVPFCGDGVCNGDEACDTCEADCDCPCGETCTAGECVYVGCAGRECGDDGCDPAGSCGSCAEHEECNDGACEPAPWCGDGTCDLDEDCAACPGDCGCGCGESCVDGACAFSACDGKTCGDDGCGGTCGACGCGQGCVDGQCAFQACEARECGDDGCGGTCGACPEHEACEDGACVVSPWCGDEACDLDESCDGCPADCSCLEGFVCVEGACQPEPCVPSCEGRECGDDGCGSSCGDCAKGQACRPDGTCSGTDTDVVQPDVATDDTTTPDTIVADETPEDQSEGSSCALAGRGAAGGALGAFLGALLLLGLARRRRI